MPVRFIRPDSVRMNDLIRVSGKYHDADISRTGYARGLTYLGQSKVFTTPEGVELLTVHKDGTTDPIGARVTLVTRPIDSKPFDVQPDTELTLFD